MVLSRFRSNGYPNHFLRKIVRDFDSPRYDKADTPKPLCYITFPFLNETWKRKLTKVVKGAKLHNLVGLYFNPGRPLHKTFRPHIDRLTCGSDCMTCAMSTTKNRCYSKGAIYQITCDICGQVYIGETGRTLHSRILEHIDLTHNLKSTVSRHLFHAHSIQPANKFTWRILHTGVYNVSKRLILESLYIRQASATLMNENAGVFLNLP